MKKPFLFVVVISIIAFLFCGLVEAKRMPAPEVKPVFYKGIKFIAPNTPQKMGYVEAFDIGTNRKVWEKKVYNVVINPIMEADVQWVFIKSLKIKGEELIVINENNKEFIINISGINPDKRNQEVERLNFEDYLGKSITLKGKAINAKVGALLVGDNFSIWIDDLDSWPEGFYHGGDEGKQLKVTGTVIEKYDLPVFVPKEDEPMVSGIPVLEGSNLHEASHRYLLKEAKWEIIVY